MRLERVGPPLFVDPYGYAAQTTNGRGSTPPEICRDTAVENLVDRGRSSVVEV